MDAGSGQLTRKHLLEDSDSLNGLLVPKRGRKSDDGFLRPGGGGHHVHKKLTHADYLVGWICALPLEMTAARSMLDEEHPSLPIPSNDPNTYVLGSISGHNIVMACLPAGVYGLNAATVVAVFMTSTFPSSSAMPLLVGIGGGVPSAKHDIRLGDVVVSMPTSDNHAIVQHDRGKMIGPSLIDPRGTVNKPANTLLGAVAALKSRPHLTPGNMLQNMSLAYSRHIPDEFRDPGEEHDILYQPGCEHYKEGPACVNCGPQLVERSRRVTRHAVVHYGMIGSGNQVIKHAATRDRIAAQHGGILCFEMEAAGVMDYAPCLVIRGICDYADEHKKKDFQGYAALSAAAFAKELLMSMPLRTSSMVSPSQASQTPLNLSDSLKLLDYAEADNRRDTVKDAHGRTCEWILEMPEYVQWSDLSQMKDHHGLLWIKGKPGTGKSTIMKFILQKFEDAVENGKEMTIISFFFNARGDTLERSTIGLYRSLMYQLLQKIPSSFDVLKKVTREDFISSINRVGYLQMMFRRIIVKLKTVNTLCIIDALDECPENEIHDMVEFFEDLSRVSSLCRFQILFSSRHYPNITIGVGLRLVLEDEQGHDRDIVDYVESRLLVGSSSQATELKSHVFRKSNGIFLWVILVVRILCREYDRGRLHKLKQILEEIPEDLNDLLSEILLRDNRNLSELILCMQWLLHARRPLGREELYYGLLAIPGTRQSWSTEHVPQTVMDNYILDCSKGLVEITKTREPVVQFIHESVRELLLDVNLSAELASSLHGLDEETSNMQLAKCCARYLSVLDLPRNGKLSGSSEKVKDDSKNSGDDRNWVPVSRLRWGDFPLLEYAIKFVLEHTVRAARAGQREAIIPEDLDLEQWFSYYQLLCGEPQPNIQMTLARSGFPEVLRILIGQVPPAEIENVLTLVRCLVKKDYHEACWAVYQGVRQSSNKLSHDGRDDFSALYELLQTISKDSELWYKDDSAYLNAFSQNSSGMYTYGAAYSFQDHLSGEGLWDKVPHFIDVDVDQIPDTPRIKSLLNVMFQTSSSPFFPEDLREALHVAALLKRSLAIQTLLQKCAVPTTEVFVTAARRPSTYNATSSIMSDTINCLKLLKVESQDINATDESGEAAIHAASVWASSEVLWYLINAGTNVNLKNTREGWTPLCYAAFYGNLAAAQTLLDAGALIDIDAYSGITPMQLAIVKGDPEFVELLIQAPSNGSLGKIPSPPAQLIMGPLSSFSSALSQFFHNPKLSTCSWLCSSITKDGKLRIVRSLLNYGITVGLQAVCHHVPLQRAVACGRADILEFLLSSGADLNEQDALGSTALHEAARNSGMDGIWKILLDRDADVALKDREGNTALHVAGINGKDLLAKKLVEKGADMHSENKRHRTPFQEALFAYTADTARLLNKLGSHAILPVRGNETDWGWQRASGIVNTLQY